MIFFNSIIAKFKKIRRDYGWYKLRNHSNSEIRNMAVSIQFVKANMAWAQEEKHALILIDNLRLELENNTRSIQVIDYGAGDPNSILTIEQMQSGSNLKRVIGDICKAAASPPTWGKLMFKITRNFRPSRSLELGTSLGISAAYQLAAMNINKTGELITIEGAEEVAKIAEHNFKKHQYVNYSLHTGQFNNVLSTILTRNQLFDLVFIDGHHDKAATKQYFELLYPFLSAKSILIFDDINWSDGMNEAWREIYNDDRITFSFDLEKWGICLVDKSKKMNQKYFKISL